MNKQDLLQQIRETRAEMEALWSGFSEEQLCKLPGPQPDWTVRDLIAHITFWEHPTLDRRAGRITIRSWGDVNIMNAELLRRSRERSLADVLHDFAESGERVLREIEKIPEADMEKESPWADGKSLGEHLADDTCAHYAEHLSRLRAWAQEQR